MKRTQEKSNSITLTSDEVLIIVNLLQRVYFLDPAVRQVLRIIASKIKTDD